MRERYINKSAIIEQKQQLLERLASELDLTRRKELFLANYVVDLTCEIRQIEMEQTLLESQ